MSKYRNTGIASSRKLLSICIIIMLINFSVNAAETDNQAARPKIVKKVLPNELPVLKPIAILNKETNIEAAASLLESQPIQSNTGPSVPQQQQEEQQLEDGVKMTNIEHIKLPINVTANTKMVATNSSQHEISLQSAVDSPKLKVEKFESLPPLPIETNEAPVDVKESLEMQPQQRPMDFTDMEVSSYMSTFLLFAVMSSIAIIFIMTRVYKLRLTRAERKYGVQSDRSTQELTPLPIAVDDGCSDDDDHTLFDRQQIRIL